MGLPCLNCSKDVQAEYIKLFAGCAVCPECYAVALRIYDQGQLELKQILTLLTGLIRTSIVQHRLALPPPPERVDGQVVQRRAIDVIAKMIKEDPGALPKND